MSTHADDDLPDETGGVQHQGQRSASGNSGQNVPRTSDLPGDDLPPDEHDHGVDRKKMAGGGSVRPGDYPDRNLIERTEEARREPPGADYYTTLEGVEKELGDIADALEIGAWEGQDRALRVQIKALHVIRQTLNGAINRGDSDDHI